MAIEDIAIASTRSYLYRPTIVYRRHSRRQAIEQRRAELQQKRQEACKKEMEERLSLCLRIIRNNGGAITRKELTELLVNELGRERSTVSTYITKWLKDKAVIEANSLIQNPNEQPVLFGCPR